jgi:hypothetical protein
MSNSNSINGISNSNSNIIRNSSSSWSVQENKKPTDLASYKCTLGTDSSAVDTYVVRNEHFFDHQQHNNNNINNNNNKITILNKPLYDSNQKR